MNNGHPSIPRPAFCSSCGSALDRYLSIPTAAKIFDLTQDAVRSMIKRRDIPHFKLGKRVRLSYAELQRCLVRYPSKGEVALDYAGNGL